MVTTVSKRLQTNGGPRGYFGRRCAAGQLLHRVGFACAKRPRQSDARHTGACRRRDACPWIYAKRCGTRASIASHSHNGHSHSDSQPCDLRRAGRSAPATSGRGRIFPARRNIRVRSDSGRASGASVGRTRRRRIGPDRRRCTGRTCIGFSNGRLTSTHTFIGTIPSIPASDSTIGGLPSI